MKIKQPIKQQFKLEKATAVQIKRGDGGYSILQPEDLLVDIQEILPLDSLS